MTAFTPQDVEAGVEASSRAYTGPVVYYTNSPYMGGMEAHIQHLASALANGGSRVGVICPAGAEIGPFRDACRASGAEVTDLASGGGAWGALRRLIALRRIMRPYRGGVLHIHLTGPHGGDLAILAARLAGIKAILRTEHQPLESPPTRLQVLRMRLRDRLLSRVVCVSQQTAEYFIALGRDRRKFVAIPNGVETERFVPGEFDKVAVRHEFGFAAGGLVVGMVSRLHEVRKGGAEFIDMAAQIASRFEGARFLVVGDGEMRPQLAAQAARLGIAGRVCFPGARTDIARLLTAMDVFVMPSHWEGGPITVLEAMAMGRPVVATNVGMVPDVVADGVTGCVVSPGDTAALTASVLKLLEQPEVAASMGQRGREVVLRGFSRDVMTRRISDLYAELSKRS